MPELQEDTRAVRRLTVDAEQAGQRIDNFLRGLLKGVPKSHIYRILRRGEVRVNKGRIRADYRLLAGDTVRVPPVRVAERPPPPRPGERVLNALREAVLYEDKGLMVLDKPAGIAVHGGSGLSFGVIEALRVLRPDDRHLELVHRLDRETSGCLLVAKKRSVLRALHELLRGDGMDKRYLALLQGVWQGGKRRVDAPLRKNALKSGERVVRVDPEGKPARTLFLPREVFARASLVEARPITGRTHQIRVHAAHLGTPIAGDDKYGDEDFNRQMREFGLKRLFLHAESLAFRLPGAPEPIRVRAPLEPALERVLERLRSMP